MKGMSKLQVAETRAFEFCRIPGTGKPAIKTSFKFEEHILHVYMDIHDITEVNRLRARYSDLFSE